jgi:dipeptidyl-peptidase-4
VHGYSSFGNPNIVELIRLPSHEVIKTLVDNATLRARVAALRRGPSEFFKVDIGEGIVLNGWIMKPADFDSTRKYPILFHVYGGPGSNPVIDSWGGSQYLWHLMLRGVRGAWWTPKASRGWTSEDRLRAVGDQTRPRGRGGRWGGGVRD